MRNIILIIATLLYVHVVFADELTLFDVVLRTATKQDISKAIKGAGGKLEFSSSGVEKYDVKSIGLPGVSKLEVIYLDNTVVFAQYTLANEGEERLRKMLVKKYGQPYKGKSGVIFDDQYLSDGTYTWNFPGNMALVYKKPFMGDWRLTYLRKH